MGFVVGILTIPDAFPMPVVSPCATAGFSGPAA